jgi:hypothetical protein
LPNPASSPLQISAVRFRWVVNPLAVDFVFADAEH